jgi:hypothetical protein
MVRKNGVGSRFEIAYPENMVVLALRTTVRAGKNSFKEVVYTPYSPQIDTPQVREAGLKYLTTQIELARKDLERRQARLYGFERLQTDVPTDVSLALSIIEHIDPARFMNCPRGRESDLVNEVLTVIGANTCNAYAYSRSTAGAMGLFQIIPPTYKRLRNRYPQAGLMKDFLAGCTDHALRFRPVGRAPQALVASDEGRQDHRYVSGRGIQLRVKKGRQIGEAMRERMDLPSAAGDKDISGQILYYLGFGHHHR